MKGAPFSFVSCVIICTVLLGIGIFWIEERHYTGTITEMGATITQKDATITAISEERDSARRENENLKNSSTNYFASVQNNTNSLIAATNIPNSKLIFDLYLNNQYITNGIVVELDSGNVLFFKIYNLSTEFATNLNITFFAPFDSSNFVHDGHWGVDTFAQPIPINHKMYDYSKGFQMEITAVNPLNWRPLNNGFNATSFSLSTNYPLVAEPIEKMREFGKMLDSKIKEPLEYCMPIYVSVSAMGSETNEYCVFLKPK